MKIVSNIQMSERASRVLIGVVLLLGSLVGFGEWFVFLIALVLIVEGIIGWCALPIAWEKMEGIFKSKKK